MTPDEAEHFYEEDEDPDRLTARFSAVPKGVTRRPAAECPGCRDHCADIGSGEAMARVLLAADLTERLFWFLLAAVILLICGLATLGSLILAGVL